MKLRESVFKEIKMRAYERNCIVAITLLATLLLLNIWPRFKADVFSFPLYAYVILIIVFSIPFFINKRTKK